MRVTYRGEHGGIEFMNQSYNQAFKKNIRWIICDKYNGDSTKITTDDLARLHTQEPVDYIIGWTPFLDTKIDLSQHPLIPRPETEYWVKNAIRHIKKLV